MGGGSERREFPRLNAPLFCRPRGLSIFKERPPRDVSLGGARIYSDDPVRVGTRLEIELFLPDGTSVTAGVEAVWVDELPPNAPARFDVGLKFLELKLEDKARLALVLDKG